MEKPIIRHCYNCQWCEKEVIFGCASHSCTVKHIAVDWIPRLKALLCRFYKKVEEKDEE